MSIDLRGSVILIEVANVRESIEFYRRALGLEVRESAGQGDYVGWAWLKRDDVELMLNAMYEPGDELCPPDPSRVRSHRDTTLFIGCPDVDGAYAHLRTEGIPCRPPAVAHYGMKQVSFSDPDGYGICLQWPSS